MKLERSWPLLIVLLVPSLARAQVTMPLTINGTLTINGGGSNSSVVTYTNGVISAGSSNQTISLSSAFPNLVIRGGAAPGQACKSGGDCWTTDFCEDGVCCCNCSPGKTAINGSSYTTCYVSQYPSSQCPLYGNNNSSGTSYQCNNCAACNKSGSGTCAVSALSRSSSRASAICRPVSDVCDVAESCDGVSMACPIDTFVAAATQCRAASGLGCDQPAQCSGTAASCPANPLIAAGTVCNPQDLSHCRNTATCTGSSNACPLGPLLPSGTVCQLAQGPCGLTDRCDGATAQCPSQFLPASTICDASGTVCSGSSASCGGGTGFANQTCM
jgi:hypothetical protein